MIDLFCCFKQSNNTFIINIKLLLILLYNAINLKSPNNKNNINIYLYIQKFLLKLTTEMILIE
jgi:hypothetical protein